MVTQYNADWFRSYSRKLSTWTRVTTIVPKFTTLRNIKDNSQKVSMDKHLIWLAQTKMQLWTSEVAGIWSRVGARVIPQFAIMEVQDWFIGCHGCTSYKQPWWSAPLKKSKSTVREQVILTRLYSTKTFTITETARCREFVRTRRTANHQPVTDSEGQLTRPIGACRTGNTTRACSRGDLHALGLEWLIRTCACR